jgi:hypothetical protein
MALGCNAQSRTKKSQRESHHKQERREKEKSKVKIRDTAVSQELEELLIEDIKVPDKRRVVDCEKVDALAGILSMVGCMSFQRP